MIDEIFQGVMGDKEKWNDELIDIQDPNLLEKFDHQLVEKKDDYIFLIKLVKRFHTLFSRDISHFPTPPMCNKMEGTTRRDDMSDDDDMDEKEERDNDILEKYFTPHIKEKQKTRFRVMDFFGEEGDNPYYFNSKEKVFEILMDIEDVELFERMPFFNCKILNYRIFSYQEVPQKKFYTRSREIDKTIYEEFICLFGKRVFVILDDYKDRYNDLQVEKIYEMLREYIHMQKIDFFLGNSIGKRFGSMNIH